MLKAELLELIANGENSGVEFKRRHLYPCWLNLQAGDKGTANAAV